MDSYRTQRFYFSDMKVWNFFETSLKLMDSGTTAIFDSIPPWASRFSKLLKTTRAVSASFQRFGWWAKLRLGIVRDRSLQKYVKPVLTDQEPQLETKRCPSQSIVHIIHILIPSSVYSTVELGTSLHPTLSLSPRENHSVIVFSCIFSSRKRQLC